MFAYGKKAIFWYRTSYGPRLAKTCLRPCAKCAFRSSCACAKYYPGLCFLLLYSVVTNGCPPTIVEGDYGNGFVRPSVRRHTPQLLLQFSRILMKLSSYCSHDPKMIISYRGHARLIVFFTRLIAIWQFFISKSCLCNATCHFQ